MDPAVEALPAALRRSVRTLRERLEHLTATAAAEDPAFADRLDRWVSARPTADCAPTDPIPAGAARLATRLALDRLESGSPCGAAGSGRPFRGSVERFRGDPVVEDALAAIADLSTPVSPATWPGAIYEAALPTSARRGLGQFFTPPRIAQILGRWAVRPGDSPPRVLDPACGGGAVLHAAFERLDALYPDRPVEASLAQLVAVDVDGFSVELTRRSLGLAAEAPTDALRTHRGSFFDLEPAGGDGHAPGELPPVDAIVGNPPYIRAEELTPDVEHFRRHLQAFDPPVSLSRRSDAYVYFLTHATRFLRPGGRLAVVLPSKWLTSDYGEGLQRFLLDRYDVHAIVGFRRAAFPDALIETVLLLAERRSADGPRRGKPVRFVRVEDLPAPERVVGIIDAGRPSAGGVAVTSIDGGRSVVVPRATLERDGPGNLDPYLRAPAPVLELLDHPEFRPLEELATVSRGVMTGANACFFVSEDAKEEWMIDERFLRPAVKSVRELDTCVLDDSDVERYLLDAHDYVASVDVDPDDEDPEATVIAALDRDGYDGLVAYLDHADAEGWNDGRTCRQRRVWFDLGAIEAPDVFVPKLLRERVFTIYNRTNAVPSNAVDCLRTARDVDPVVLVGVLNSALGGLLIEAWARDEAGMLQLMTYETASLPVPDLRAFSGAATERIGAAVRSRFQRGADAESGEALDRAVLEAAPVQLSVERVRALTDRMRADRLDARASA